MYIYFILQTTFNIIHILKYARLYKVKRLLFCILRKWQKNHLRVQTEVWKCDESRNKKTH